MPCSLSGVGEVTRLIGIFGDRRLVGNEAKPRVKFLPDLAKSLRDPSTPP